MGLENFDVWAELDGDDSNNLATRYFRGDKVDEEFGRVDIANWMGTPYWTLTDRLGSVRDVIDSAGLEAVRELKKSLRKRPKSRLLAQPLSSQHQSFSLKRNVKKGPE